MLMIYCVSYAPLFLSHSLFNYQVKILFQPEEDTESEHSEEDYKPHQSEEDNQTRQSEEDNQTRQSEEDYQTQQAEEDYQHHQPEEDEKDVNAQLEEDEQLAKAIQESLSVEPPLQARYDSGNVVPHYPFFIPSSYR